MLGNQPFYNRTIRKIVVAFGTLFNDIHLVRYNKDGTQAKEHFKVPLSYGAKEKYVTRITSDPTLTKSIATIVPRISFELTGMSYDSGRKLQSTMQNFSQNSATKANTQYNPVPYDFNFSLAIYVRNTEDGTQILEQILPFFTPDFTVTVDMIPSMDQKYDLPIILNSVDSEIDYEGDLMNTRLIIWNLTFTVKGYIWPPVKTGSIIRQANTNLYIETNDKNSQKVFVNYGTGSGYFKDGENITSANRGVTGKLTYFSNSNTGIVVVNGLNKLLQANDVIRGVETNAKYTITRIDPQPVKTVTIVTTPDPINAEPDDEFGFSENIIHYPDTV